MERSEIIEKAKIIYNDSKYCYDLVMDANKMDYVFIICEKHGIFKKRLSRFLNGSGCPICSGKSKKTFEEFLEEAKIVHNNFYVYNDTNYVNSHTKIGITCPIHGVFFQTPTNHLNGCGCPECKKEKLKDIFSSNDDSFKNKSSDIHNGKYIYTKTKYVNNSTDVIITCPIHGDFKQAPHNHLQGKGCPICGNILSKCENEIAEFLESENIKILRKDKKILNKKEIDIFLLDYNIGIEYDGLHWHSEQYVDNDYHINKTNECLNKGIRLIHIFEDEWQNKKEIVKSRLNNIIGITEKKIFARKCQIKEIENAIAKDFLENNHIQGNVYGKISIGLFYNDELVSLMTFGNKRKNLGNKTVDNEYELLRFCNKLNTVVIGGASKLFKYFLKTYNPQKIISYCDLRWSDGNLYEQLGFKLSHISQPNYFYIKDGKRLNRFCFRKDLLVKEGFDENKTEHEIMLERKIYRIYDCGCKVYQYIAN